MSEGGPSDPVLRQEILAAERSRAYGIFCTAFSYPEDDLCECIRSGALADALREVLGTLDPDLLEGVDWGALCDAGEGEDDLAIEFTRLFDVGASGPPCPLYGGFYTGTRMKTMEEAVRFYNHFGLTLAEDPQELPDHLTTELEFLHFLAFQEAQALPKNGDAGPYQRAQRDFVARHPGRWLPKLRARLEGEKPAAFFRQLVRLLERFLEAELARVCRELGAPTVEAGA